MIGENLHSSIQPDPRVKDYYWKGCKYYYLPLFNKTLFSDVVETALGARNPVDRKLAEVRESIVKAEAGHYSHIKIPVDRANSEMISQIPPMLVGTSLGLVYQVCTSFLHDHDFYEWLLTLESSKEIEWVLDDRNPQIDQRLTNLCEKFPSHHLSLVVYRDLDWCPILTGTVLQKFKTIHLYFSYQFSLSSPFLSCKDSHRVVGMLRKQFPEHEFLPPKGVDLWDHRARADFDMEPLVFPCFKSKSANPSIRYSVVIPTYNNQNHLRVVLKHLYRQNVGLDQFEVIVVDDGGTDQTQALVMQLLREFPAPMNFKYVFFQRQRNRVMGDSQYRAGISRNVGVKNAEGEILSFLDSDIIVPRDYLAKVGESLQTCDALQAKRINLSQPASSLSFDYDQVDESKDCIPDEPYWEAFVANTTHWDCLPYNWKYVCTHSFSIRKDLFWEVGGLKKNYIFYGFEDTDLGYRLVKGGYKLHLLDVRVYHMFHENTRSEFLNLKSLRHSLLSRTAQIFYLHHLDEDIFENLLGFMEPEPTFQRFTNRVFRTMSLQFIWRPKPRVYRTIGRAAKAEK